MLKTSIFFQQTRQFSSSTTSYLTARSKISELQNKLRIEIDKIRSIKFQTLYPIVVPKQGVEYSKEQQDSLARLNDIKDSLNKIEKLVYGIRPPMNMGHPLISAEEAEKQLDEIQKMMPPNLSDKLHSFSK